MSKLDQVYTEVRSMIVSGELPPGAPIDKAVIAQRIGASRQPIAAAIDRLSFEGLVEVVPQHGSFVAKLNRATLSDWFMVRAAMEVEFITRFVEAGETAPMVELERNVRYQKAAAEAGDIAGFYELDIAFHQIITRFTPCTEGHAILERAQANLGRVRQFLLPQSGRLSVTLAEHQAIFDAVRTGVVAQAAAAIRAHIHSVESHLQAVLASHPELAA